jgi:hypothetical protein
MYFDNDPCEVCGSEVRLEPRAPGDAGSSGRGAPVGPADGVVGDADSTVDRRVCTNPDCPTNKG